MRTIDGLIEKYKDRKINILTAPTHERYQSGFKDINATFHMVQFSNFKPWNNQYAPLPKNHILWPKGYFPEGIRFDLVLSQNKFGQFQFFYPIARSRNIPLISLEHTLPMPEWSDVNIKELSQLRGDINIFISNYSRQKWGFDDGLVVNHMVDTDLFKPSQNRKNKVLSVVNDYINRDYCCGYSIYKQLVDDSFTLIGDTPGLSEPAKSIEELALQYSSHKIFLNTSTVSPLPTALLESMSCLPPGEFIFFDYQCEKIEDIINLKTFGEKTKDDLILKKHIIKYNDSIFNIKANHLPSFRLTRNHPVATVTVESIYDKSLKEQNKKPYRKVISDIKFKDCQDLSIGDWIVVPKPKKDIKDLPIEDDWLRFYGLFIAEGYTNKSNICLTFHENEKEFIDFISFFSQKYLDRNTKIEKLKNEKSIRCIFSHSVFARKLDKYFCGLSHEKRIHDDFMQMNERQTKIFLDAYFDGDGYRVNKTTRSYSTTSPYLARQIFYLLMKLGFLPTFTTLKAKIGKIRGKTFVGKPIHIVGFTERHRKSKKLYLEDEENFYVRIKNIHETHYIGDVYNLSTESNTFTNPFALTHNCGCAVVSTNNCMIPEVIQHGVNGFMSNDISELRGYIDLLMQDDDLAYRMGVAARKTILEKFSKESFNKNWSHIIERVAR